MLPRIRPMRLKLVKEPFDSPEYIFELKHDGWRAIAYIQKNECKLISQNNNGLRFRTLAQNLCNEGIVAKRKQSIYKVKALADSRSKIRSIGRVTRSVRSKCSYPICRAKTK
jgi:ATP-dependent DNA ligase